ncbi:hypothetical protein [Niastella sp. OAS944]|uniref:hypothetical protein n=1 Tax=Niastella sp. OAS944 TaxID=2664089 RepID=UPI0034986305
MKKVQLIVASIAVMFAITTTAFTGSKSSKFVNYFSSVQANPVTGQFDQSISQDGTVIKNNLCPGANNQFCRNAWLPSHLTFSGTTPTGRCN